ncbi:hypothetical protein Pmani_013231 [Petrolisthes manimaculis]|uniref:Endonuclease/exonuclease/phosphatase domain-containing protein n=1 Tax=Petrolisthes manimaculis TaxID=1843537 RepID=A0AAE1PVD1_9EUCA|nr:hypothetical protein Pmani_013231 [Petrolisthes manimaculis]
MAGLRNWKPLVESLHAGGLDVMVGRVVQLSETTSRSYEGVRAAIFRVLLLAPVGEAPIKGGVNKTRSNLNLIGLPRPIGLLFSGRNNRKILNTATWNVLTLLDREENGLMVRRSAAVAHELERCDIDVAALQETRLEGNGNIKEKSHTIFWAGVEPGERRIGGVALAIRNNLLNSLKAMPSATCDRIISVRIPLEVNRHASIFNVYTPTMSHSDESKKSSMPPLDKRLGVFRRKTS